MPRAANAPPPGDTLRRSEGWGVGLLVAGSLALLPLFYRLLEREAGPVLVLGAGFLSMALGWSAGFFLERRKLWFARLMAAAGVVSVLALPLIEATGMSLLVVLVAALSLAALVMLRGR